MTSREDSPICGYADRLSVAPGETVEFKVSSERAGTYRAELVRLVNGDTNPAGPGFKEVDIAELGGERQARFQATDPGSYVLVEDGGKLALSGTFTLQAFVYATTPEKDDQVVLGRYASQKEAGYALALRDGRPTLVLGGGGGSEVAQADEPLYRSCWYSVAVGYDPETDTARLYSRSVVNSANSLLSPIVPISGECVNDCSVGTKPVDCGAPFLIAGCWTSGSDGPVEQHFNGKIDAPKVWARLLSVEELDAVTAGELTPRDGLIAAWDFANGISQDGISSDRVADTGPHELHGRCVHFPARAMTGWNWDGIEERFIHAPHQYGAIHFHEDDIEDCEWETGVAWTAPDDVPSGVYALRLTQEDAEDWIPFFVLPPRGRATAKTLLLVPTASYLVYTNEYLNDAALAEALYAKTPVVDEMHFWLHRHPEFGLSTYDTHSDGSGIHYASGLRPMIHLRPKYRMAAGPWQFPADLHLVAWLDAMGFDYDVATDRELHDEGAALLGRYNVVLTGSHPEYYSEEMMEAWEKYLGSGGRGMYLGGNGFYWIIAWHPEKQSLVEIRRGEYGNRAWQALPGEYYMQINGRRSGLWRGRGRAPQKNFGTGFATECSDESTYFVQMPDARDPRVAFIMEGVDADERIGDFGLVGGGAAGIELDRYDLNLGTPPETLLLAYSEGHSDNYVRVVEDIFINVPMLNGTMDPDVRGDIVYFSTKNGGAVFATSSIAWCGSLLENGCDNNVSRITANALRRFSSDEPLPPLQRHRGDGNVEPAGSEVNV
jgi:N,N-dimethylformamidase